ncbi:hypothetical protein Pyn_28199 [Prunus yedoensis var. nudiflora]|uniref:Uncharacterized protein n=1 Tax=Prunus yedoensis var. nudiflora TaxID=2094558 RepID=A0A314XYF0_PRUYE|nr:hypothetical protein Pyn_28199 [Prunus yedoensis var. nudiflora]
MVFCGGVRVRNACTGITVTVDCCLSPSAPSRFQASPQIQLYVPHFCLLYPVLESVNPSWWEAIFSLAKTRSNQVGESLCSVLLLMFVLVFCWNHSIQESARLDDVVAHVYVRFSCHGIAFDASCSV